MSSRLQVTMLDLAHSDALSEHIKEKFEKVAELDSRITSCHVTVEQIDKHHRQGREYRIGIVLRIPDHEFVISHIHDDDAYVALRDAFSALTRKLQEVLSMQRGTA